MSNTFSSQILTEKLSKLNNSQQSIETLSHWCIFHRKKAKQIAETWRKLFNSSAEDQKITFLFLANDVLQNSKRKGTEFVNEFWKFLPEDLKNICENGDDRVKNAVKRLVVIWDERKVFGSRGQGLKDAILGKMPPPPENNGKSSNPVKVVRNTHSVRIKLAAGGRLEKIVTAYQSVLDEHSNEDTALDNCKTAVLHVANMEKEVDGACTRGIQPGSPLMSEVQEQEFFLKQSIQQLESVEAKRADLISQLKEALQEQESKNELIQNQLQVAQAETERTISMKQRIISATAISAGQAPIPNTTIINLVAEPALIIEPNPPPLPSSTPPPLPLEPRPIFSTQLPQPLTPCVDSFSKHPPQPLEPVTTFANSTSAPLAQLQQPMIPFANSFGSPPPQPLEPMTSFTNAPPIQLPQQFMPFANSFSSAPPQPPQPSQTPTSFTNSPSSQHPQPSPPRPATSFGHTFTSAPPPPSQPVTSFATSLSAEEQHKKAVAAIAAKLAASTSSAQMLTSALSSLAAEEAASKNGGRSAPGGVSSTPPPKRLKLEKPMSVSDTSNVFFGHMQPQVSLPPPLPQISTTSAPQLPQTNCPPPSFPPPQPPLPPLPPPPRQPYIQTSGAMLGVMPYSFGGNTFSQPPLPLGRPGAPQPPPPPLPPVPPPQQQQQQQQHQQHSSPPPGFFQPPPQPQQQLQQQQQQSSPPPGFFQPPPQQQQQQQQSSPPPGFFQPPGMGFYGQLHSTGPSTGSIDS